MAQLKWGVLSTGAIANDFTMSLKKNGSNLHAVASRSQASADEFKKKHGFTHAFSSYEALAASDVDIIYVATPHAFHCDNILMCLEAGKHVLSEKPMACNAAQAERCIAKAREKKLYLMEGMWTRFFPTARAVRQEVKSGAIGKVVSMTASFGFKGDPHSTAAYSVA
jgi:predicted dehydrogenase